MAVAALLTVRGGWCAAAHADETLCNGIDDDGDGRMDESPSCFQNCQILEARPPEFHLIEALSTPDGKKTEGGSTQVLQAASLARTDSRWAVMALTGAAADEGEGTGDLSFFLGSPETLREYESPIETVFGTQGMDLAWSPAGLALAWASIDLAEGDIVVYGILADASQGTHAITPDALLRSGENNLSIVNRPRIAASGSTFGLLVVNNKEVLGEELEIITMAEFTGTVEDGVRLTQAPVELIERAYEIVETDLLSTDEGWLLGWSEVGEAGTTEEDTQLSEEGLSHSVHLGFLTPGTGAFRRDRLVGDHADHFDVAWTGNRVGVVWQELSGPLRFTLLNTNLNAVIGEPLTWPANPDDGPPRLGWNGEEFALTWNGNDGLWLARISGDGEPLGLALWEGMEALDASPVWSGSGWGILSPQDGLGLLDADCYCDDPTDPDCPATYVATASVYGPYGYSCRCQGGGSPGDSRTLMGLLSILVFLVLRRPAHRHRTFHSRRPPKGAAQFGRKAARTVLILGVFLTHPLSSLAAGESASSSDAVLILYGGVPASGSAERDVEDLLSSRLKAGEGNRILHVSELMNFRGGGFDAGGSVEILRCAGEPTQTLSDVHSRADEALRRLDYPGAVGAYDGAIASLPCSAQPVALDTAAELFFRRGLVLFRLGEAGAAKESFRQAFLFKPNLPWDDDQPPRILRVWAEARSSLANEKAAARISLFMPREERLGFFVDGRPPPVEGPMPIARGIHLVTARSTRGPIQLVIRSDGRSTGALVSPSGREALFLAGPSDPSARPLLQTLLATLSDALGYDVVNVVSVPGSDPRSSLAYRYDRNRRILADLWEKGEVRKKRGNGQGLALSLGGGLMASGPYVYADIPVSAEWILPRVPLRPRLTMGLGATSAGPDTAVILPHGSLGVLLHGPGRRVVPLLTADLLLVADGREGPLKVRPGLVLGGGVQLHPPRFPLFLRGWLGGGPGPGGAVFQATFGSGYIF